MYIPIMIEGRPNELLKRCFDCYYCQGAGSWWCLNKEAVKARGTSIPGVKLCRFWKPCLVWDDLRWYEKWFTFHVKIKQSTETELEQMIKETQSKNKERVEERTC